MVNKPEGFTISDGAAPLANELWFVRPLNIQELLSLSLSTKRACFGPFSEAQYVCQIMKALLYPTHESIRYFGQLVHVSRIYRYIDIYIVMEGKKLRVV